MTRRSISPKRPGVAPYTINAFVPQLRTWQRAAARYDMSVSEWIRRALDAAAAGRLRFDADAPMMTRGQPKLGEEHPDTTKHQFRVEPDRVKLWDRAALRAVGPDGEALTTAEWCRQALDFAAQQKSGAFLIE